MGGPLVQLSRFVVLCRALSCFVLLCRAPNSRQAHPHQRTFDLCSADWQSAVPPIGNRRTVVEQEAGYQPAIQPTGQSAPLFRPPVIMKTAVAAAVALDT